MSSLITRFAPAPTGLLHLGHVLNAVYVWGLARGLGARVLLRIEDHDRQRSTAAFEAQLLDDLDWLGFVPDLFPTEAFRAGRCGSRQTDREPIYRSAALALESGGHVYGCACTRQQIAANRAALGPSAPAYPGTCRDRHLPLGEHLTWRVRFDAGIERFDDLLRGPAEHDPAGAQGDPAIRDRHGNWTYTFAVVVDDWEQQVNLVVRGADLETSTGTQIRLARMLGRPEPARFAHHPLVMTPSGRKLSKAAGDTGIRELRRMGWTPHRVVGQVAALAGLIAPGEPLSAAEVVLPLPDQSASS